MSNTILVNSFNCRGLRDKTKRQYVFNWLKKSYNGITFLQETHCSKIDEILWQKEFNGKGYFSNGTNQSRGVAILTPDNLQVDLKVVSHKSDQNGRFIMIECEIESTTFTFVNVYAPTRDHLNDQLSFMNELRDILINLDKKNLIIGGDFNTHININLDKKGGIRNTYTKYTLLIENIMDELDLVDIWRVRHPNEQTFTLREKTKSGLVQSRLDLFLVEKTISYQINSTEIKPGYRSDHSIIILKIELLNLQPRGPGLWKFNN